MRNLKLAAFVNVPKVDKKHWAQTMENIVLFLKFVREVRGIPLGYVTQCHIKMVHIQPRHDAHLNLDKEMITRVPIVDGKLNFKLTQGALDRACNTFKINNALMCQILSKIFMDMNTYLCM